MKLELNQNELLIMLTDKIGQEITEIDLRCLIDEKPVMINLKLLSDINAYNSLKNIN